MSLIVATKTQGTPYRAIADDTLHRLPKTITYLMNLNTIDSIVPTTGRISEDSPVGRELLGRSIGDTFSIEIEPDRFYKIVGVKKKKGINTKINNRVYQKRDYN
jgi:acetate kinase